MFEDKLILANLRLHRSMKGKETERSLSGAASLAPAKTGARRKKAVRSNTVYVIPSKHGGYRDIKPGSRSNERGFTIFNGHQVQHESGLEHRVSIILQADNEVADIFSQAAKIHYVDADVVEHFHIFDYVVKMKSGVLVGVAVKPERYRSRIETMFEQMFNTSEQTDIDKAVFYSDLQATREKFANARDILWAREDADEDEVRIVAQSIANQDRVQFWELYDRAFMGNWRRKAAIWRLIDLGVLTPVDRSGRIDDLSHFTVTI